MKTFLNLFVVLWALTSLAADPGELVAKGPGDGAGGAGVTKNGLYMTFYSAGLYVQPLAFSENQIPGLDEVIASVTRLQLGPITKGKILEALIPSQNRRYYVATPQGLTSEVRQKLTAEFVKVTGQDSANITLFGLTDKEKLTTYLLPEFFSLETLAEKQAALMHEALWISHPNFTYNDIVQTEMAFQAILENPMNFNAVVDFISRVSTDGNDLTIAALYQDIKTGTLTGLLDKDGKVSMGKLFGEEFFNCTAGLHESWERSLGTLQAGLFSKNYYCSTLAQQNIYRLSSVYKNSFILKILLRRFRQNINVNISRYYPFFNLVGNHSVGNVVNGVAHLADIAIYEIKSPLPKHLHDGLNVLGVFAKNCTINFKASVGAANMSCPDFGSIHNIRGTFTFGVPRKEN